MDHVRVVIIDGSISFISLLNGLFGNLQGFDCIGYAVDGESGLNLIRKSAPDLLVVDTTLPGIDGLMMLRRIPLLGLKNKPKILLTPTFFNDSIGQEALDVGVNYMLPKPVSQEVLRLRLQNFRDTGSFAIFNEVNQERLELRRIILSTLLQARVPPDTKGFGLMLHAVMMAAEDLSCLSAVTKRLYPALAKSISTTPACVERNLRHAIARSWILCPEAIRASIFGYAEGEAPSNSAYVAAMTFYIVSKLKEEGKISNET